jgi:hypothetical protein
MGTMALQPLMADVREYFTMGGVEARARAISDDERTTLRRDTKQLHERRVAGEALWTASCSAQALRLMHEAWEIAHRLTRRAAKLDDDATDEQLAVAYRLSQRATATLKAAREAAQVVTPPPVDDEAVKIAHVHSFASLRAGTELLERLAVAVAMSAAEVARTRLKRRLAGGSTAFSVLVFFALVIFAQRRIRARASATYSPTYEAPRVLDGNTGTEWLLPDGQTGWLDLELTPARKIKQLKLMNAHNWHYHDRGTKEFSVEFWSKSTLVKTIDGEFGPVSPDAPWTTLDVYSDVAIDRVRFVVKSFYIAGGGLGEVTIVD